MFENRVQKNDFASLPITKHASRYSSRKFPLHALTILSGHSKETTEDYYNDGKTKALPSYAVWQYTISGRGCIELGNNHYDLLPDSLMVVSVPGPHVYYLPEFSSHWEFVFLVMIGREALRITRLIEQKMGTIFSCEKIPRTIDLLYEITDKLFSGEINNPFNNSNYTYQLCMRFLEELDIQHEESDKLPFQELTSFLKENIHRDIPVEAMAEFMHISRSHLTRIFGKEMGMSPRMYLEDMRLKMAMDILFEGTTTVKETAARCGMYDVNYFCRLFRKRFGISPGKYRERLGKS
jgi:AraC-like DNA-binding protein